MVERLAARLYCLSLNQDVQGSSPCVGVRVGSYCRVFGVGIRSLSLKQVVAGSIPAPAAWEGSVSSPLSAAHEKYGKDDGLNSENCKYQSLGLCLKTVSGWKGRQACDEYLGGKSSGT